MNSLSLTTRISVLFAAAVALVLLSTGVLLSQAVEVGFTAKSVVLDPSLKNQGTWVEVDPKTYSPIAQGVVLLKKKTAEPSVAARRFYDFLFSKRAHAIFRKFGYRVADATPQK